MAKHTTACTDSKMLCEELFGKLNQKIPNLERKVEDSRCEFAASGKTFALVYHSAEKEWLRVWFWGDVGEAKKITNLRINPTNSESGPFGNFEINRKDQLDEAHGVLTLISYPFLTVKPT